MNYAEFTEPTEISDDEHPSIYNQGFTEPTPDFKTLILSLELNFLCKFVWTGRVEVDITKVLQSPVFRFSSLHLVTDNFNDDNSSAYKTLVDEVTQWLTGVLAPVLQTYNLKSDLKLSLR